jgi:hypothetical protein
MKESKVCCFCKEDKALSEFNNKSKSKDGKQAKCRTCSNGYDVGWRQLNHEHDLEYHRNYNADRYRYDADYRTKKQIRVNVRRRANNGHAAEVLGCTNEQYNAWLRYTLPQGYTMDDIGIDLHVDHVLPLSAFNPEDVHRAYNWSNVQLLRAIENLRKGNRILNDHTDRQIQRLNAFAQEYPEYIDEVTNFTTLLATICIQ